MVMCGGLVFRYNLVVQIKKFVVEMSFGILFICYVVVFFVNILFEFFQSDLKVVDSSVEVLYSYGKLVISFVYVLCLFLFFLVVGEGGVGEFEVVFSILYDSVVKKVGNYIVNVLWVDYWLVYVLDIFR